MHPDRTLLLLASLVLGLVVSADADEHCARYQCSDASATDCWCTWEAPPAEASCWRVPALSTGPHDCAAPKRPVLIEVSVPVMEDCNHCLDTPSPRYENGKYVQATPGLGSCTLMACGYVNQMQRQWWTTWPECPSAERMDWPHYLPPPCEEKL